MSMLKSAEWQLNKVLEKCTEPGGKEMQRIMNREVMELLKVFEEQGHSGFSASWAIRLFSKLAKYKLITEIEDNPEDWDENGQHKYIPSIFKRKDGTCYYLYGTYFAEPDSDNFFYNGMCSKTDVTFPLKPSDLETKYIRLHYKTDEKSIADQLWDGDYEYVEK